ncbi:MAG TPA: bifunctional diguanylate cyclase/phosphodiesterase [Beijerinckiaceae bacterium]
MHRFRLNYDCSFAAAILLVSALLAGGAYWVVDASVERMVRKDAEAAALGWGRYLASNLADLEQIAAGEAPSPQSLRFIERARVIGQIFRFKLFDASGQLRLVSDDLGKRWDNEPKLAIHNPAAAAVMTTGQPYTEIKHGKPPLRPPLYAETYLPVRMGGRPAAIVEVYLNQTDKQALFHEHFALAGISLAILTALSFGVPGCALYLRSRQKNRADARARYLAHHDAMTDLLNRATFVERLDDLVAAARSSGERIAVHSIDLDNFKDLNDALGHDVGDEVVAIAAQRLLAAADEGDLVARLGGDEFVIAQRRVAHFSDVEALARRVVATLCGPMTVRGRDLAPGASVGIALAPDDGATALALLRNADLALDAAKAAGRKTFRAFEPAMDEQLKARLSLETLIREATECDGFDLFFQPIVSSGGGDIAGFEALLRLPDGAGGFISPTVFVPVAEEMGLIARIGEWVLRHACRVAATWPEHLGVSVNLSPKQFSDGDIHQVVKSALRESGLNPRRLELEITEGLLLKNTEAVLEQLRALKAEGVSIAMDDFGTGYSSLSYLMRFPFDKIKIDRSFMQDLDAGDGNAAGILRTIISLGHLLKMSVTAEGIETATQAEVLRELACDYIQGFHYGRAAPELDVATMVLKEIAPGPAAAGRAA